MDSFEASKGNITAANDIDFQKIVVPITNPAVVGFSVKVTTAGLSSLQAALKVYDPAGTLLATTPANRPGEDLTIQVNQPKASGAYYMRVSGNAGGLGVDIGSYRLKVVYQYADGSTSGGSENSASMKPFVSNENHTNDVITAAANIAPRGGNRPDARFDFSFRGSLIDASDVDFYKANSPSSSAPQKLNIICWGLDANDPAVKVEVFDALYRPISSAVITGNEIGTYSVQVPNTTPGSQYFVKVSATNPLGIRATGNCLLGIDFSTQPTIAFQTYATDTLTRDANVVEQGLTMTRNRLYHFKLAVN